MRRFWLMCWKTCRLQTMYALLNAQMSGIYNETELSLSLREQRTGEIKHNLNGLCWKSPRCLPARVDCLCYWECLENPPRLPFSRLCSCPSWNFQDNIYRQLLFQQRIAEQESRSEHKYKKPGALEAALQGCNGHRAVCEHAHRNNIDMLILSTCSHLTFSHVNVLT